MASIRDLEILLLAKSMLDNEQRSGVICPFCHGNDKSLSLRREGEMIFYHCHRARCGISGMTRASPALTVSPVLKYNNKYAETLRAAGPPSTFDCNWVAAEWGMQEKHVRKGGLQSIYGKKRIILPIYDMDGYEVGATLRSTEESVVPKSLICMTSPNSICASFYEGEQNPEVVIIVEDQASAIRASYYCSSVALLGTNMDVIKARAIARTDCKRAIFCLDKDAFSKSILLANKWGSMFPSHTVVLPSKDLKDMTEIELRSLMTDKCNLTIEEG